MSSAPTSLPSPGRAHPLRIVGFAALAVLLLVLIVVAAYSAGRTSAPGATNVVQGSGTAAIEHRAVAPFTSIDLAGANNVTVAVGGERRVTVRADDNLMKLVTTRVEDGQLVIGNHDSFRTKTPMSVEVTIPSLDAVALSGSGNIAVDGVRAGTLTVHLPGSGTIRVSGTANRLEATVEGSGELELGGLVAARATAVVAGTGTIHVQATNVLDATVSGVGTIVSTGHPRHVTKDVTGSGSIVET